MYTDQTRVESYLQRELTEEEVSLLAEVVESVSSFIDSYTGRHWSSVGEDDESEEVLTSRFYDGNGKRELFIDDFTNIESIKFTDNEGGLLLELTDDTKWVTYPLNAAVNSSIKLRTMNFPSGVANIEVSADFRGVEPPKGVIMACTGLVSNFLANSGDISDTKKSESIEGYSYTLMDSSNLEDNEKSLLKKLDHYKKITL